MLVTTFPVLLLLQQQQHDMVLGGSTYTQAQNAHRHLQ
jgi:hypothetical protein